MTDEEFADFVQMLRLSCHSCASTIKIAKLFESSANTTTLFRSICYCVIDWVVLPKWKLLSSYFITEATPGILFVFVVMLVSLFYVTKKVRCAKDCSNASQYDVFVCYDVINDKDDDFVKEILQSKTLKDFSLKFCVATRDFVPGKTVTANIQKAIQNSGRCIYRVSKPLVDSKWYVDEFFDAHSTAADLTICLIRQGRITISEKCLSILNMFNILTLKHRATGQNHNLRKMPFHSEHIVQHFDFEA